jgi:site-specific DNA recombinase
MRAGIYARVSTDDQAQHGYSINEQIQSGTQRANELHATEIVLFVDEGVSGATLDRPELTRLREEIRQGLIDIIILRDPDRLSRKLSYQLILTEEFEKGGAKLEFLDFTWENTPEGRLFYSMKGAFSEYEREKIKERMIRGKNQKARQGGMPMNFTLFGYDYSPQDGVSINTDEAEVVKYIYSQLLEYRSPAAITIELNERGVPTKRGKTWYRQVVRQILSQSAYKGEWHYQKNQETPIKIPVPQIIDTQTWEKAQEILTEARRLWNKHGKQEYLLSGLITCIDCGTTMGGANAKYWGRKVRSYTCRKSKSTNRIPGCYPDKYINANSLELIVWEEVKSLLSDPEELMLAINKNLPNDKKLSQEIDRAKKQIGEAERGRAQLIDIISLGLVELDPSVKSKLYQLKQRKESLERRVMELEREANLVITKSDLKRLKKIGGKILKNIDELDFEDKKRIVRSLVSQINISGRIQGTNHKANELPGVNIQIIFDNMVIDTIEVLADARS